jgi:uncharacterized protein (TIGR02246 family)
MSLQTNGSRASSARDEAAISALHHQLLECWNWRSAADFAALFTTDGNVIGFDGSQVNGRVEIESHLHSIFTDHEPAEYVGKIREVRLLAPDVAILRAVAGMVPPGQTDLDPAVNTIQTLVAVKRDEVWRIALYQNTPAQFHGRPDLSEALTQELRQLLK